MRTTRLVAVVLQNVRRNRKNFIFSAIGITVGVCVFSFFTALTMGVRVEVLNRIYPVDLIEVEPASVNIAGTRSSIEKVPFREEGVEMLLQEPGVGRIFPKLRSRFQATYRMGGQLFGQDGITFEAYFDGLDGGLLRRELKEGEEQRAGKSVKDRLEARYGRDHRCYDAEDCSPGEDCQEGLCQKVEYWSLFRDWREYIPCRDESICAAGYGCRFEQCRAICESDEECLEEETCLRSSCMSDAQCGQGSCVAGHCSSGACFFPCTGGCPAGQECIPAVCAADEDCLDGPCLEGQCALGGTCTFMRCVQRRKEREVLGNPDMIRGERPGFCDDGTPVPEGGTCMLARCPVGSYCSVHTYFKPGSLWRDKRGEGRCEQPIPVVLNPIVMEIFNMVLGSTLDRAQLGTVDTLLGYGAYVTFGHSFYKDPVKDRTPVQKHMLVVGFSNKALEAGVTMPMAYVDRANSRYKGKGASQEYDSMIIQLAAAEHLPSVMAMLDRLNIQLSRRSSEAEKFRTILLVAIAIFFIMASIILAIAAVNITHTFLMVIYERNKEIGIQRALGATKMDIRLIFLGESVLIGLAGGAMGNGLAYGLSQIADFLANRYIGDFPFQPETFFLFEPLWVLASTGFAIFFSLVGAFFPANRAARMDPARTLTVG